MTVLARSMIALMLSGVCSAACAPESRTGPSTAPDRTVQIIGSDTMVNLVQAWAEAFSPSHPDFNLSIRGGGSGTGLAALINNSCDIAMSSRPISKKETDEAKQNGITPVEYRVGLDGLIVIVHPANPVSALTLDQLRSIFLGIIRDWGDVGGDGGRIVILSRESNSGTYLFFKEHVLRRGDKKNRDEFSPHALLMPSSQAIVNEVTQNPHAIGYVGLGYLSPRLKALAVATSADGAPVTPSISTVADNSYPISRPLFFYSNGEPQAEKKDFLDFALSVRGQQIVVETDFVPVGTDEKTD